MSDETIPSPAEKARYDSDQLAAKDEFHRRPFAARVADIIVNRPLGDPLVVAMVGEWGSGKSTTLGYVKENLSGKSCGIAPFNPWRYTGEDALLLELFSELVQAIDPKLQVLTKWQELKRWIEANQTPLAEVMQVGGNALMPGAGYIAGGALGFVSGKLRTRIEQVRDQARVYLERSQKRVVVLLDDIDRLEADDMLTLMRLLKLTGDLPNVTYVLAMDEDHVSRLIGQRLDGTQETGRSYLEKIVNVRLSLPRVPDYKLKSYTLGLINEVLAQTGCDVSDVEARRTIEIFDHLCAPLITTPRRAKSVANAYRFALGLLPHGELNAGDLLIIESLRLLCPNLHAVIHKEMPKLLRGFQNRGLMDLFEPAYGKNVEAKDEPLIRLLAAGKVPDSEIESHRHGLVLLFPQLQSEHEGDQVEQWAKSKRICSIQYFWRYFSGAIQDDDVGDHIVYQWLAELGNADPSETRKGLVNHLKSKYANAFMAKLRLAALTLKNESIRALALTLAAAAKDLPQSIKNRMEIPQWSRAASLAAECLSTWDITKDVEDAAGEVINTSDDLHWCFQFIDCLPNYCRTQRIKAEEGIREIPARVEMELASRVLQEFAAHPPESPEGTKDMVWILWRNRGALPVKTEVTKLVQKHPDLAIHFLAAGCNYSDSVSDPKRPWKWNGPKSIQSISEVVDLTVLRQALEGQVRKFPDTCEDTVIDDSWDNERDTIELIARRFLNEPEEESVPEKSEANSRNEGAEPTVSGED